jgi:hypothetical protein
MKKAIFYFLSIIISTCFSLNGQAAGSAIQQRMKQITSRTMPSGKYKKVKIPGLDKQIIEHKNVWKSVSPGFVNVPTNVVVNGDTITMAIDIGGLMQSQDGGKNWKYITYMSEGGITGKSFCDFDINPQNQQAIVLGGNRIYQTVDGGKTWSESYKGLPPLKYATRGNGYGQVKFNSNGNVLFTAIGTKIVKPAGWRRILARNFKKKFILFSNDNGNSFKRIDINSPFSLIRRIYAHPWNPNIVYFAFEDGGFYMTKNAMAEKPELVQIEMPNAGYFVRDIAINPKNKSEMLLTLTSRKKTKKNPSRLFKATDIIEKMTMTELKVVDQSGKSLKCRDFVSIGYNPNKASQVVIGVGSTDYMLISENNLKSFRMLRLPKRFYADGNLSNFYGKIERVYFGKSKNAVVISRIGSWISDDNFSTLKNLTMVYKDGKFSNRGVGSPANINSISICRDNAYFSAQDHRAWKSCGSDYLNWILITSPKIEHTIPMQPAPWGLHTWFWHIEKNFASYDEKYVYINCNAFKKKKFKHDFWKDKKIFCSYNQGKAWQDVTAKLGRGDVYPEGSAFLKVLFTPSNSSRHWILFSKSIYYTDNGGKTFSQLNSPLFTPITPLRSGIDFSDLAYDMKHDILYLSARVKVTQHKKLNHNSTPAALYRSYDRGKTWQVYNVGQNAIRSLGVTTSGTLVLGTQKTAGQPARLIVIPYGKKYDESRVKLTLGDTPEEISANQISIWPIKCDGEDILAYSNVDWIHSDRFFAQGPLLSRDGGKTFKWINHNLPCTFIWSADMRDGKILLGTVFGLMYWKYK